FVKPTPTPLKAVKKLPRRGRRVSNGLGSPLRIIWSRRALTPHLHEIPIFSQFPSRGGGNLLFLSVIQLKLLAVYHGPEKTLQNLPGTETGCPFSNKLFA